jgi:ribosome-associated protein
MAAPIELPIPESELEYRATRSGGPGGQHVNTSSTRVEVRWNVLTTVALDEPTRARVVARLANRIDADGWVRVVASDSRSQHRNREAARDRLVALVSRAAAVPNVRRKSRVPPAERRRRLQAKKRRGEVKRARKPPTGDD